MKVRKNDTVIVMTGKDKWKKWTVLKVLPYSNRVLVEGVNIVTRNYKKQLGQPGQSVQKENPIHISNVMIECPFTSKPTRVWYVFVDEKWKNKKFRFSKKALKEKWWDAKSYLLK